MSISRPDGTVAGVCSRGKTRGLDQSLTRQAAWLEQTFAADVEIRFQRGGIYGGAYLVNSHFRNRGIGLCAGLIRPDVTHRKLQKFLAQGRRIYYAVYMKRAFVKPRMQRYSGDSRGNSYFFCKTLREARSLLLRKLNHAILAPRG